MTEKFNATPGDSQASPRRSEAEIAPQEHDWRLRYAMESAGLTYVEVDLARGQARTAENFAAVMGYPSPQAQEDDVAAGVQALLEHVVPDDRERVEASLRSFTSGLPVGRIEYRVLGDDGIQRWIESRWSMQSGAVGQPLKSFATNLDITERKLAAQALRASDERCRLALDSAELGACRAWGVEAKFGPSEDSFCRVCRPIAVAMGQKAGEKWTAAAKLQPTIPKPDRLLGFHRRGVRLLSGPARGAHGPH